MMDSKTITPNGYQCGGGVRMNASKKKVQNPTLCWKCRNAVPKISGGKYIAGCSWSIKLEPVEGWTARKSVKRGQKGVFVESWNVQDCPEYEADCSDDAPFTRGYDDAYIRIASIVLEKQMQSYRDALEKYAETGEEKHLYRVRSIERELLSPYYAALAMHSVDFRELCNEERRKVGLPELEEMQ